MRIKIIWLLLIFPGLAAAQQQEYRGPLQLGVLQGDAEYFYTVKRKDTVFQGPFRLQGSGLAVPDQSPLSFFSIDGEFEDNLPMGNWKMRQGEFYSTGKGELKDHHYRMKVSGVEHFSTGTLEEGKPDQNWKVYTWKIENSDIIDTVVSGTFSFDEGVPDDDFRISRGSLTIKGSFDDGLADEKWEVFLRSNQEAKEIWQFEEGVLQSIAHLDSARSDTFKLPVNTSGSMESLALDDRYFEVIEVLSASSGFDISNVVAYSFGDATGHFQRTDSVVSILSESSFMPSFQAKLHTFPYSSTEEEALDDISENVSRSNAILDSLRSSAQLNLLKLSDTSIYFSLETAGAMKREFITSLERIGAYHRQEILKFLPRESVIPNIIPEKRELKLSLPPAATGGVSYSKTYRMKGFDVDETSGLFTAAQLSQAVLSSLYNISDQLEQIVQQKHREKQLVSLEESLMAEYAQLQDRIDSLQVSTSEIGPSVWNGLKTLADKELNQYSALEDRDAKAKKAEELTKCFQNLDKLAGTLAQLPRQNKKVEETYTQKVWNPYTYTYMSETVKKRILNAYREELIPHLMDQITHASECKTALENQVQLEGLFERMIELRMMDTGKLEKKLRKNRKPEAIIKLFGLDENQQEN